MAFLIMFQVGVLQLYSKETLAQVDSYKSCENSKNISVLQKSSGTLLRILGEIFCEVYHFILTRLRYYLIFCDMQRIQLGIQLSLYFCENFQKKSELDTV